MPESGIPYIDLIIVVALLFFVYKGFQRGFVEEFLRIFGTLVALFFAIRYMSDISKIIIGAVDLPPTAAIIVAFSGIFVLLIYVFKHINKTLKKAIKFSLFENLDKILGGALGLFKGAIIISLITMLLSLFSFSPVVKRHISQSQLFDPMRQIAPLAYSALITFVPNSKSFIDEFDENFYGISNDKKGEQTNNFIEYYRKK
jgi:membrane protein required for colicin V production